MDGPETCSKVEAAFGLLSRKWVGLLINTLMGGEQHFCELERALPALSARVLTVRMKELEQFGIVDRIVSTESPIRVSYRLTAKGRALEPVMRSIADWAYQST
jgi:DNA-binding HxlR family transcriptional regulator